CARSSYDYDEDWYFDVW
nr:immunoglobulin heavy chain junction region [Mus musculus]MBK4183758.1 immunoglobulin heavy chain junction region [Mus musculus]